ncbi:titin-like, partial [Asbolus verrucosus]
MSEEDCPKYKDGDIVWVKLGSCWWPGEVTENGPEDFSAKKPPLVIVKFFNESTYEFVKSYNNIYFYNCERKNEFIKKGMDSFRANNSHMEKFPGDVSLAEIRTDGNPNILSDPIFAPQKRSSIIAEVFGSPTPKKSHKDGARHSRGRTSSAKNSAKKPLKVNITHRRFLGCDDYEAHIRVQYPGKDTGHQSSDEEIARLNAEPTESFNCSTCSFQTNRLEVMLFHVQCHIKGIASPVQVKKKASLKKVKKSRIIKHITSDDDRTNSSAGYLDTDSEEEVKPKQKRKRRSQGEWSDSEDNEEMETTKLDTSGESTEHNTTVEETPAKEKENKPEEQSNSQQKDSSKSCFDFDEEEEEDNSVVHTALGRKIPRVIPPSEKRRSTDPGNEDASLPIAEDDENRMEILKVNENLNENLNSVQNDAEIAKEESVFKDLMESTSVPELPEVPESIKPPQNFPDSKLIKIPDKKSETVTEVATKLTNPKKRFVKSFEDFELLLNEQRRAQEEKELEESRKEKDKTAVAETIEPKIMSKLSDEEAELAKLSTKAKSSHRTPRKPNKSDVIKEVEAIPEKNPDEEIGKVSQIDDYLNDFLFTFEKKSETPKIEEEEEVKTSVSEEKVEEKTNNEVLIKCASNDESEGGMDIAIKTNLTNFSKNEEEMSALSTLAMVSELETSLDKPSEEEEKEPEKVVEEPPPPPPKTDFEEHFAKKPEPELVTIDGNLTVVSEKDLADGQVEITANASPTYKKPVTLTNFSMDFSECNSDSTSSEKSDLKAEVAKEEEKKKAPAADDMYDLEEHIPSQIVDKSKPNVEPPTTSKLLERLTTTESKISPKSSSKVPAIKPTKTKFVIKPSNRAVKPSKPIIISEKIIKPGKVGGEAGVSVQKITSKRNLHDPDEIDTFIIQKGTKTVEEDEELELSEELSGEAPLKKFKKNAAGMDTKKLQVSSAATAVKKRGKAKILQQTIITPAGEIIQPTVTQTSTATTADDNVFDINSMPIVLSDQILTPESIANMPIFLGDTVQATPEPVTTVTTSTTKVQTAVLKKTPQSQGHMRLLNKSIASPSLIGSDKSTKLVKTPKILGSVGSKIIKQNSFASSSSKHGKYVIVTQSPTATPPSKYTVGKKQTFIKRDLPTAGTLTKVQNIAPEPSGNKIMILTNQQGQQQRVLLTPAQQKMMGYQNQGTKVTKTLVKGNIIQKAKDGQVTPVAGSSGLISKSVGPSRLNSSQNLISSSGHVLTPIHPHQSKTMRIDKSMPPRKLQMQSQKVQLKPQKTILIKNQHGQTVRKIQGTDDALLDQQVAEQIEAIKASGVLQQKQEILNYKTQPPKSFRRSYAKKIIESPKPTAKPKTEVPPLAPISPKKPEAAHSAAQEQANQSEAKTQERPLNQLVIQDAMGNQTTITEGQILALPSETIDGQPQSYMLVTLDESGNLTPLNNEALLSLDPNLGLGGDLGNTVLQIDQSALKEEAPQPEAAKAEPEPEPVPVKEEEAEKPAQEQIEPMQNVNCSGEPGQQLIVTGDPIAAQKFLESLAEGSTDLANILASAEGSNILIHADGQQILINTDSDNQMLLSVNTDLSMAESTEGGGNPIFATQPSKNQDILAAALADTDVFQQEQNGSQTKLQSQLSPNSALYPMNVGNVLETSLTLNSPIMTPLEVPSTKKISDESDILTQVPKNVDLPITITDPNITQTVSQQQVASLMANELQTNLELSLPISESAITVTSSEMNSPSFVYSLPSLDGAVDITQKPFNSSMPLLTEDGEEATKDDKEAKKGEKEGSFLDESEGLCTLGGEMCSSLSEPPPDMFDLSAVLSSHQIKTKEESKEELKVDDKGGEESSEGGNPDSVTETSSPNTMNEDSCEIPVQPDIVATLKEEGLDATESKRVDGLESERCT